MSAALPRLHVQFAASPLTVGVFWLVYVPRARYQEHYVSNAYTINLKIRRYLPCNVSNIITRSTGTVHTSAKARLTSVAISVPPSGESVRDRHQNLNICSLAHCQPFRKISSKSVWTFLRKVANKQITTKTTSLAEVKRK